MSALPPRSRGGDRSSSSQASPAWAEDSDEFVVGTSSGIRPPRSLPPWIDSYRGGLSPANEQARLLRPPNAVPAQHNALPVEPQRRVSKDGYVDYEDPALAHAGHSKLPLLLRVGRVSARGRKWDHLRSAEPVIVNNYRPPWSLKRGQETMPEAGTDWHDFIHASSWGRPLNEESEVVDIDVLEKLQPNFARPAMNGYDQYEAKAAQSRRRRAIAPYKRVWNIIMRHSLSPLLFRLIVMVTSIVALGVASRIFYLEDTEKKDSAERTQSVVAIVVDCVAIPYIAYMIWDEYTGKPLGLRSAVSKMSLILLDLIFIIFKSASTALAFESLIYHNVTETTVRELAKALASFMLIGLISWTMTFTVNIFRTVERLGGGEEEKRS